MRFDEYLREKWTLPDHVTNCRIGFRNHRRIFVKIELNLIELNHFFSLRYISQDVSLINGFIIYGKM